MVKNVAGRLVPTKVNGREVIPFKGVHQYRPTGRRAAPPISTFIDYPDGNKLVPDLRTALERCGLADGMTISTHHHFRDGDVLANQLFDLIAEMGVKNLRWFPSATFPCHAPMIKHLDSGVIHHIEGSLNGPLGLYCSQGKMKGMGVLRSHGGRYRAIRDGDVHIDITVIAAPTADPFGNCNGMHGASACGPLGFSEADSMYADKVIVVTDNLVPMPCYPPWQIEGNYVDCVVEMDKVGTPEKILSGTTEITRSPNQLLIAETASQFVREAGILHDGLNFQAGAGGISLAFVDFLHKIMAEEGLRARCIIGGITRLAVDMLEGNATDYLIDGQAFDQAAIENMRENSRHICISPFHSYDYHSKGNQISFMDVIVLGATEVDVNFNANVVTHSDGLMLHGIGGWQNCMFAQCTMLAIPSFRNRMPVIRDEVTTICAPGEVVDVVVTERGLAINPRREDLIEATKGSKLPIRKIEEIKQEVEELCGGPPERPELGDKVVAVIEWVDGTVLDSVYQVKKS
ncbi:MAG: citrate lyase subunit alpha [Phycisphaerae bacterium SM23_30]|nr:MAG: citrate lyase subunit alpha [Phycisphaerae bacterium SM23_30]